MAFLLVCAQNLEFDLVSVVPFDKFTVLSITSSEVFGFAFLWEDFKLQRIDFYGLWLIFLVWFHWRKHVHIEWNGCSVNSIFKRIALSLLSSLMNSRYWEWLLGMCLVSKMGIGLDSCEKIHTSMKWFFVWFLSMLYLIKADATWIPN